MKKFIGFLTIIGVLAAAAFVFFTVTPVGKDIWSNITTKVDTVETVDNTDDTTDTTEPEKNILGLTKEESITELKITYTNYQGAIDINDFKYANIFAGSYFVLAEDSKKTWKDFASLMKTEGLPESLQRIKSQE